MTSFLQMGAEVTHAKPKHPKGETDLIPQKEMRGIKELYAKDMEEHRRNLQGPDWAKIVKEESRKLAAEASPPAPALPFPDSIAAELDLAEDYKESMRQIHAHENKADEATTSFLQMGAEVTHSKP